MWNLISVKCCWQPFDVFMLISDQIPSSRDISDQILSSMDIFLLCFFFFCMLQSVQICWYMVREREREREKWNYFLFIWRLLMIQLFPALPISTFFITSELLPLKTLELPHLYMSCTCVHMCVWVCAHPIYLSICISVYLPIYPFIKFNFRSCFVDTHPGPLR